MAAPVVPWSSFVGDRLDWHAGEHVTAIGQTGSGKSQLVRHLLPLRRYSVVVGTKPRDDTLRRFRRDGWRRVQSWPPPNGVDRVLLWPSVREPADLGGQRLAVGDALEAIFVEGAWAVYIDELPYVSNTLGQGGMLELLWLQGRALGVSLVAGTQRPAHVPLVAYSQATHLFMFRTTDERDLRRLREFGGVDADELAHVVRNLPRFAFVHAHAGSGELTVSRAPAH